MSTANLYANYPVIDDSNYQNFADVTVNGEMMSTGYWGGWKNPAIKDELGSFADLGVALLSDDECKERVRQNETDHTRILDMCDGAGLHVKNQKSVPYCWIFAPVRILEIIRLIQTGQKHFLSPASAGARIKNFRSVGGWGSQGYEFLRQHGCNYSADWPDTAIDRRYLTPENIEKAKFNIVLEGYVLESWQEHKSCLAQGICVASGLPYWSHEVCDIGLTIDLLPVFDNSWSPDWGANGRGTRAGSRMHPGNGDYIAITAAIAA
jgi:hypothetical protein